MPEIKPISKSRLKYFSRLSQKKYRQEEKKFLIEGVHLVEEVVKSGWKLEELVVSDDFLGKWKKSADLADTEVFCASASDFRKISETVSSQGIIGLVAAKQYSVPDLWQSASSGALIVALDGLADPGNVGTILRTCDWFGVDFVLISENSVELFNPKVVRSTMGSLFHLPVISGVDLPEVLKVAGKHGFRIISATSSGGKPLAGYRFPRKTIIVFGNEAHGVSAEVGKIADVAVTVPRYGNAESLNVSVACGVVLSRIKGCTR